MIEKLATYSIKIAGVVCIGAFALLMLPMAILVYLLALEQSDWLDESETLNAIGVIFLAVSAQALWLYILLEQIV